MGPLNLRSGGTWRTTGLLLGCQQLTSCHTLSATVVRTHHALHRVSSHKTNEAAALLIPTLQVKQAVPGMLGRADAEMHNLLCIPWAVPALGAAAWKLELKYLV